MNSENIKIIFFGTPEFAAGILKSLIDGDYSIAAVFTQPDKKVGRRREIVFSPVKKMAVEKEIKVFQPESLRDENIIENIRKIKPDLIIVAAYGKILQKVMLEIPKFGAINIHASLLPKYRGASPVQCAILSGEKKTGITLMQMNEKMDEGDILQQEKIEIGENETADALLARLGKLGEKMIVKLIPDRINGKVESVEQDHDKATYCKPIGREDGKIDWDNTAGEIFRQWRAYHPWPGIFSILNAKNQPKRLKLSEIEIVPGNETGAEPGKIIKYNQEAAVQAKKGLIVLKKIQLEGKKEMDIEEFLRGNPEFIDSQLE